jgi:hypothetical protein
VHFCPTTASTSTGVLCIKTEDQQPCMVKLNGRGVNVDVVLSDHVIDFDNTYVTKSSQKTFSIANRTSMPLRFALKQFATADEEQHAIADSKVRSHPLSIGHSSATDDGEHAEGDDMAKAALLRRQVAAAAHASAQQFLYINEAIHAFPLEGTVYPHSEMEVRAAALPL